MGVTFYIRSIWQASLSSVTCIKSNLHKPYSKANEKKYSFQV